MGKLNGVNFHGTGLYFRELEHRVSLCFFMLNSLGAFRRIFFTTVSRPFLLLLVYSSFTLWWVGHVDPRTIALFSQSWAGP